MACSQNGSGRKYSTPMRRNCIHCNSSQIVPPNTSETTTMPATHSSRLCPPWAKRREFQCVPTAGASHSAASISTKPPNSTQTAMCCSQSSESRFCAKSGMRSAQRRGYRADGTVVRRGLDAKDVREQGIHIDVVEFRNHESTFECGTVRDKQRCHFRIGVV